MKAGKISDKVIVACPLDWNAAYLLHRSFKKSSFSAVDLQCPSIAELNIAVILGQTIHSKYIISAYVKNMNIKL